MKLIEYLKELNNELNFFVICINADCEAFDHGRKGVFDLNDMEEMTFFRTYARNILKNKKAMKLLEDTDFLSEKEEKAEAGERVVFVTVSCKDDYLKIRKRLTEILN